MKRTLTGILTVLGLLTGIPANGAAGAGESPGSDNVAVDPEYQGEPVHAGFLIVDGEYIPPPYTVSWAAGGLQINGYSLPLSVRYRDWEQRDDEPMSPVHATARRADEQIGRLERRLAHGEMIILARDGRTAQFPSNDAITILSIAMGSDPRSERLVQLLKIPVQDFGTQEWGRLLDRITPTDELTTRMAELRKTLDSQLEGIEVVHGGTTRSYSYALTVVGMLLVVIAFGTVLTFRPTGQQPWRTEDRSAPSVTLVVRCVLLMVVLSFFDLACTYLARSAGQFTELNPLADTLMDNPSVLIGFKVALTGLAALILWRLRFYRGTQVASWWLCLLLTLLAVRWVAVESLLMA